MNRAETETLLQRITTIYGRRPPDPATITEWHYQLAPHTATDLDTALDRRVTSGLPGPTLAELIALIPHHAATNPPTDRHQPDDDERQRVAGIQLKIREELERQQATRRRA